MADRCAQQGWQNGGAGIKPGPLRCWRDLGVNPFFGREVLQPLGHASSRMRMNRADAKQSDRGLHSAAAR